MKVVVWELKGERWYLNFIVYFSYLLVLKFYYNKIV